MESRTASAGRITEKTVLTDADVRNNLEERLQPGEYTARISSYIRKEISRTFWGEMLD
jgi:hypothetical protein